MKTIKKMSMLFVASALMMVGGLTNENATKVSAEENIYKTLDFAASTNESVNSYYGTWSAKSADGDTYTVTNGNNYKGTWAFTRFGVKSASGNGSITTPAFAKTVSKVDVTVDDINASTTGSLTLQSSTDNKNFTDVGNFNFAKGKQSLTLTDSVANSYYRLFIQYDNTAIKKNGTIQISKLEFYTTEAIEAVPVTSITASNTDVELYEGNTEAIELTYAPSNTNQKGVTYASSNTEVATVSDTGVITAVSTGSATITVTSNSNSSVSTTINVVVKSKSVKAHAGTLEDPYSIADALLVAKETGTTATAESYYIKGIVSSGSIDTNYGNATFKLVDTLEEEELFTAFRIKDFENAKFTDNSKIEVYDEIVVYAPIVNHNGNTPETNYGYVVSIKSYNAENFIKDWKAMRKTNNDSLCEAIINNRNTVIELLARYKELGKYQKGLVDEAMDLNCTIGVSVAYADRVIGNNANITTNVTSSNGNIINSVITKIPPRNIIMIASLSVLTFAGYFIIRRIRKN